jgi:hypothetical protein
MEMPALRDFARPFVGREREMQELRGALDEGIGGRGRLVLLIGEPGIGKSRTAEEIAAVAAARGAEVLIGRCYEGDGAPALWPWVQILRTYTRGRDGAQLDVVLGAEARDVAHLVPEIGRPGADGPAMAPQDPDSARFRLFDALATVLGRAATARPLMLLVDDLQGADQPSLLFLRFLARGLRELPLLVVGTFREVALTRGDVLAETLADLIREPVTTRLSLRGFNEAEVTRFIELAAGVAPPPALAVRVHERTEGNPFFVGEIVRWLVESGQLDRPGRAIDFAIPQGVRAAVARHLGRLSDACASMLRLASGFGREFRADAVARAGGLEPDRLAALLTEAVTARLIGDVPDRPGRYRFAHAITRDTLYDEIPAPHRADVHRRLAEALEAETAAEVDRPFAELSAQFQAANDRRGIDHARRAGDRALELLAYEEAVRQYGIALAALDRMAPGDEATRCDLMIVLASAQNQVGEGAAAKKNALCAAESARRRGGREQFRHAALAFSPRSLWGDTNATDPAEIELLDEALAGYSEESPLHVKLLARLATALYYQADAATRRADTSERAVAMARRLCDRGTLAYALHARHLTMWAPGNAEQRIAVATELVHIADATRDTQMAFEGHFTRFCDYLELGNAAALAVELEACERLSDRPDPYRRVRIIAMRAMRALVAGRLDDANAMIGELQELHAVWPHNDVRMLIGYILWGVARQRGDTTALITPVQMGAVAMPALPVPRCILAALYAHAGRLDDARREYDAFVPDGLDRFPREMSLVLALSQLAEACRDLNDEHGAEALYAALLPYEDLCVASGAMGFFGAVDLYLGTLATMRRRWETAARHFEHALAVHEGMDAAPWVARTRYEHAAMLAARAEVGDVDRARTLLAAARAAAETLGMAELQTKVETLASSLATRHSAPAPEPIHPQPPEQATFRRRGDYWTIAFEGASIQLRHTRGLGFLGRLLLHPGREFHAGDLARDDTAETRPGDVEGLPSRRELGGLGDVVDATGRAQYRVRLAELRDELAEAERLNDLGRIARAREEMDVLTRELVAAARGGRASSHGERARIAVTKGVKAAVSRIATVHPALGRHLTATVRCGYFCVYLPDPRRPIRWAG